MTLLTPTQFFALKKQALRREMREVLRVTGRDGVKLAKVLSSGPYSRGHPYARRHGTPLLDPAIINKHRGVFFRAWHTEGPRLTGNQMLTLWIVNDSDVAKYLNKGTRFMVKRPIAAFIVKNLEPYFRRRVADAVKRAFA